MQKLEIQLSLKDAELVERGLQQLGARGERALARLQMATRQPTRGMQALRAAASELSDEFGAFSSRLGPAGSALGALGPAGLAAAAGIGAAVAGTAALINGARRAAEAFDALQDSAERTGVGVETLQELQFAFGQSGAKAEEVERGLIKLNDTLGELRLKGDAPEGVRLALEKLGLTVDEVRNLTVEQFLPLFADGLQRLSSQTDRAAVASELLGDKIAAKLVPGLQGGSDGLRTLAEEARKSGAVIEAEVVEKGAAAADELAKFGAIIELQVNAALVEFAPLAVEVAKAIASMSQTLRPVIGVFVEFFEIVQKIPSGLDLILRAVRALRELRGAADAAPKELPTPGYRTGGYIGGEGKDEIKGGISTDALFAGPGAPPEARATVNPDLAPDIRELSDLTRDLGLEFASAFEEAISGGKGLSEVLHGLAQDLLTLATRRLVIEPLFGLLTQILQTAAQAGLTAIFGGGAGAGTTAPFTGGTVAFAAQGGVFSGGHVVPFARGGVVTRPTLFPMARGAGLMGEAGPEAVMPLRRLPNGNLGVQASGGAGVVVNIHNNTDSTVKAEERRRPGGGLDLNIMIDALADHISRDGSTLNRAVMQVARGKNRRIMR